MHPENAQAMVRFGDGSSATSLPHGVDPSWIDDLVNAGASSSRSVPPKPPLRMVSFAETVEQADDDCVCVSSEKPPLQEDLRAVLRLLYQLFPSAASSAPVRTQKACDFEGLFATDSKSQVDEPPPVFFHRVAELWSQSQLRCQAVADSGCLPSAASLSLKRTVASCAEECLRGATPFNTNFPQLIRNL